MRQCLIRHVMWVAVLLLTSSLPAKPGVVTNLQGQTYRGDVTEDDKFVYVHTPTVKITIDRRNVATVVYATPPTTEPAMPAAPAPLAAPEPAKSPEDIFKNKGLIKTGFMLIVPEESALHDSCNVLRAAKGKLAAAAQKIRDAEAQIGKLDRNIKAMNDEEHDIDVQVAAGNKSVELIARQNLLVHQINSTRQDLFKMIEAREKLVVSKSDYITATLDAAEKASAAEHAYDGPRADKELAEAIDKCNETAKPKVKLGPSAYFNEDLELVKQCNAELSSGIVPVTPEGGVPNVDVLINGKLTQRMIWDSGCSGVTLSAKTAKDLGLKPMDSDPVYDAMQADGTHIKLHVKTLDSIRIGPYTVENVECQIASVGTEGSDLLGTAFQSRFRFKLDMANQTLQLTPLFTDEAKKKKERLASTGGHPIVDLLEGISATDQAVKGTWEMRDGSLYSDQGDISRIDFNYHPPKDYDYKVTFTRLQGNECFSMTLVANGRQFQWIMGGWDNTTFTFDQLNAMEGDRNPTAIKGRPLETGKTYTCIVQVRSDAVSAYLDGQLVERYATDYRDLNNNFPLRRQDTVGLMTHKTSYVISSAQIIEISGHGTKVTPSDPTNVKLLAVAHYVAGTDNRTVKIYDNGHFGSPGDDGNRWFLRGHSVIFRWGGNVDEFVLSDDLQSFRGHNRNYHGCDNMNGELISGSFIPQKPPAPGEEFAPPSAIARRAALPTGLVLYLPFDKSDKGDVAHDHSPAHLSLPMHDVVPHAASGAGTHGTASFSDGAYIDGKSLGQFPPMESFSISLWVNAPEQKNGPLVDNTDWQDNAKRGFTFRLTDSKPEFVYSNGDWQSLFASAPLAGDVWHHLAVTCDAKLARVYVDGIEDASTRIHGKPIPAKFPLQIGRNPYDTNRKFTGMLSEVMIFNRALTAEEVMKLAGKKN